MYKYHSQGYCPICHWSTEFNPNGGGLHGKCSGCGHRDNTWNTYLGSEDKGSGLTTTKIESSTTSWDLCNWKEELYVDVEQGYPNRTPWDRFRDITEIVYIFN